MGGTRPPYVSLQTIADIEHQTGLLDDRSIRVLFVGSVLGDIGAEPDKVGHEHHVGEVGEALKVAVDRMSYFIDAVCPIRGQKAIRRSCALLRRGSASTRKRAPRSTRPGGPKLPLRVVSSTEPRVDLVATRVVMGREDLDRQR